jgi:hypothetical protein
MSSSIVLAFPLWKDHLVTDNQKYNNLAYPTYMLHTRTLNLKLPIGHVSKNKNKVQAKLGDSKGSKANLHASAAAHVRTNIADNAESIQRGPLAWSRFRTPKCLGQGPLDLSAVSVKFGLESCDADRAYANLGLQAYIICPTVPVEVCHRSDQRLFDGDKAGCRDKSRKKGSEQGCFFAPHLTASLVTSVRV